MKEFKKDEYINELEKNKIIVEKAYELFDDIVISYNTKNKLVINSEKAAKQFNCFKLVSNKKNIKLRCSYKTDYLFNGKKENFEINYINLNICMPTRYWDKNKSLIFRAPPENTPDKIIKKISKRALVLLKTYPEYKMTGNLPERLKKLIGFI